MFARNSAESDESKGEREGVMIQGCIHAHHTHQTCHTSHCVRRVQAWLLSLTVQQVHSCCCSPLSSSSTTPPGYSSRSHTHIYTHTQRLSHHCSSTMHHGTVMQIVCILPILMCASDCVVCMYVCVCDSHSSPPPTLCSPTFPTATMLSPSLSHC